MYVFINFLTIKGLTIFKKAFYLIQKYKHSLQRPNQSKDYNNEENEKLKELTNLNELCDYLVNH